MSDWKRMKWLPVGAGALLCVLGLASLLWPAALVRLLPILIGLAVLVLGTAEIAYRLAMRADGQRIQKAVGRFFVGIFKQLFHNAAVFGRFFQNFLVIERDPQLFCHRAADLAAAAAQFSADANYNAFTHTCQPPLTRF